MITLEEREFHAEVKSSLGRIEKTLGNISVSLDKLAKVMEGRV